MRDGFSKPAMAGRLVRGAVLACLLALSACGGGGDGGQQAGVSSGGTGSFSNGPVTAKGSIVVTGVHFDHSTARTVTDADGTAMPWQDLDLGMMVEVEGGDVFVAAEGESARSTAIRVTSELIGPVTAIEDGGLRVMGQAVRLTPKTFVRTKVGGAWRDMPLAGIGVADVVEVHGFQDVKAQTFIATRIEKKDAARVTHYVVRGVVQDLSDAGCRIGSQRMDFAWAGKPGVRNGIVARAVLYAEDYGPGANWRAKDVQISAPLVADHGGVRLEGLVTEWVSETVFSVNGVVVNSNVKCGACVLGAPVRVRGEMVNSVLKAESAQKVPAP